MNKPQHREHLNSPRNGLWRTRPFRLVGWIILAGVTLFGLVSLIYSVISEGLPPFSWLILTVSRAFVIGWPIATYIVIGYISRQIFLAWLDPTADRQTKWAFTLSWLEFKKCRVFVVGFGFAILLGYSYAFRPVPHPYYVLFALVLIIPLAIVLLMLLISFVTSLFKIPRIPQG